MEHKGNEDMVTKEREAMGLITIKQDGLIKIIKGVTTIEEVERVTEGNITKAVEAEEAEREDMSIKEMEIKKEE